MRIGPREVEVELVGVDFGEEVSPAGEIFQVEKLIFFEAVHRFDVALVSVRGWRDAHMLTVAKGFRKVAFELTAVVGLPDQVAQRDSITIQMSLNAGGKDGASRSVTLLRKSPEQQAATNVPGGVLDGGQVQPLGLQPVAGDIVEILGIGADLLEQGPLRFDVREVLLALIFSAAFPQQPMFAPDALERAMADGQAELPDQAARAEGGKSFAEFDELRTVGTVVAKSRAVGLMPRCLALSTRRRRWL